MTEKKVTALKVQKRNPERVNVYLDGEYAFGLARIVAAWLQVGAPISDEKIAALKAQDTVEAAYQRALHFLSFRPRSEGEITRRLISAGYEAQTIETVITRLITAGLVGDAQFAQTWVENRTEFRPRSRTLLKMELRQKGVPDEIIQTALHEIADEDELAYRAGKRNARRWANLDWNTYRMRATGYLGRRGFSYSSANLAVKRLWEEIHQGSENLTTDEYEEN